MNRSNRPVRSKGASTLARRDFLKLLSLVGSAAGMTALLDACQQTRIPLESSLPATLNPVPPTRFVTNEPLPPTSTQIPKEPNILETPTLNLSTHAAEPHTKIALIKTDNRTEGIRKALDLLGTNPVANQEVFLKPNFNSADPAPGSTHPDTLRTLIIKLQEMGASRITVADRSGMGDTRKVFQKLGVFKLAEELGFSTLILDELAAEDWVPFNLPGSHWKQGFPIPRPVLESKAIVQTCCLKTHRYGGHFTLSLKNSVGLVAKKIPGDDYNYMNELHNSPDQRLMIAEINAAYQPAIILMDAVDAFVTGGPDQGNLVHPGMILAGNDRIAIDAAGIAILRSFGTTPEVAQGPVFKLEQIARAAELGLGVTKAAQIEFLTSDLESESSAAAIIEKLDPS